MTALLIAALSAGMVSVVNPCGFAMLPAYLAFFVSKDDGPGSGAIRVALAMGIGFLGVFVTTGAIFALGLRSIVSVVPWLAVAVGLGLIGAGLAQLFGKRMVPYLRGPGKVGREATFSGMVTFGAAYAVASLSCTLPIFLSLVASALASGSPLQALGLFVAYAAGMTAVVGVVTVAVAGGRSALVHRLARAGRSIEVISGWVMLVAGAFIVWYWATVLSAGAVTLGTNSVVRWIDGVSASLTNFIRENVVALVAATVLLVGVAALRHEP